MQSQSSPDAAEFQMDQGLSLVDVWQFVQRHFVRITIWVVLGCMFYSGVIVLLRSYLPRATVARQTIRFTFDGADRGEYPNGMPFSPKDVLAAPVLEQAYSALQLSGYLKPEDFAARLTIFQASRDMEMLQMEYQQKLGNAKLSQPERESLERDFRAKMDALRGRVYTLSFDASDLPMVATTAERVVSKLPECWAAFAQTTRGVKDYDIPIVTVTALSLGEGDDYLVQAELLRSISTRLADGAKQLQQYPGGNLVRDTKGASLAELIDEVNANYRIRVLPNYINYLRLAYAQDPARVNEVFDNRIATQERTVDLSRSKAESLSTAFRNYLTLNSGGAVQTGTAPASGGSMQSPSLGLGGQMPAIMSLSEGFFDKVIAQGIQSKDVEYRQRLNERQIDSAVAVLDDQFELDFDKWMLGRVSEAAKSEPVILERVQAESKVTAERLQSFAARLAEFHKLLSQRNLNAASQLYRNEDPVVVSSESSLPLSRVLLGLVATGMVMFVLGVLSGLSADRRPRLA
jgi:hypothetical protein